MSKERVPNVVIGAGPVGLAAAAHLLERDLPVVVLEAASEVAANVAEWSHVRLFSPWRQVTDSAAVRLLVQAGWDPPDPHAYPTGASLIDRYLRPLSAVPSLRHRIRLEHRVVSILRWPSVPEAREDHEEAFIVIAETPSGTQHIGANAVIDASGTWGSPNVLGKDGSYAAGELEHADRITYRIPDVLGKDEHRFAGRRVAVVGSGHSAQNVVADLAELRTRHPDSATAWVVRRDDPGRLFGAGTYDPVPARARLGAEARRLVAGGAVELVAGFQTAAVEEDADGLVLVDATGSRVGPVDEIVANVGFRPDLSILDDLHLDLDPELECSRRLAPVIDPRSHTCGTVPAHGVAELRHPEDGLFVVGMKSFGRAPTFLLATGYEQVRSVAANLAGDDASAAIACSQPRDACGPVVSAAASTTGLALGQAPAGGAGAGRAASCCGG